MLSEEFTISGREYNFDYKEQANRTIIVISSQNWDKQDDATMTRLRELLAQRVSVNSNPGLPRMLFVQKKQPDGISIAIPIDELKRIIKSCLDEW
jgi:hypothetical protein